MRKDNLFGRKLYLDSLEKRIRGLKHGYHQNIAVIGDESIGKTSIIFHLLNKFYDPSIIISYLEVRPESEEVFIKRFIATLLYNFLVNSSIPLKEDLNFLINKSYRYIPKTVEKIKTILVSLEKRKRGNVFSEALSLSDSLYQESGKSSVIILDEFSNLESLGIKNLYREWSKLLVLQKNTMYIIVSSMKHKARNILAKNLSLLFGNFELITVEPFDIRTSEQYLKQRLEPAQFDRGLSNFIVDFTGGYPLYLSIIIQELIKDKTGNLAQVFENLLFEPSGILNQRFSNYIKRFLDSSFSQEYISILHSVSNGYTKIKDIAHILHKQKKNLMLRINHLIEVDAIERSGDFLRINDRIFSFWLKFVYQEKLNSLTFDAKNQKDLFRGKIENMMKGFIVDAQKPIRERISEVLRLFNDDMAQIEKKKLRLSHFREIKPLDLNSRTLREGLIGRSNDGIWILAFKHDYLTEEDIIGFSKECKKYKNKLQKKIIIALKDVDQNSRLRALEEKIWTWDINNVNQLLDLFAKSRVIV